MLSWNLFAFISGGASWIPAIAGIYAYKNINSKYKPFVYLLIIYVFFETTGQILFLQKKVELLTAVLNVFVFIDFVFLYLTLNFWKGRKVKYIDTGILLSMLALWIIDNTIIHTIHTTNSLFRIIYSVFIVIQSIDIINKQVSITNFKFTTDPILIIGLVLLIQFTFKTIYETAFMFSPLMSNKVYVYAYAVHLALNFVGYIMFTKAILCMSKSTRLTSSY